MPSETTQNTNGLPLVSKSTENSVVLLPKERDPVVLARVCDTRLKVAPPTLHGRDETLWLFADSDKLFETLLLFNKLLSEWNFVFFHLRLICVVSFVLSFHCKCHQETPLLILTITLMLEWMFLNGTLTEGATPWWDFTFCLVDVLPSLLDQNLVVEYFWSFISS